MMIKGLWIEMKKGVEQHDALVTGELGEVEDRMVGEVKYDGDKVAFLKIKKSDDVELIFRKGG